MDRFLKEFIQLEKVCNEMFDVEHGVSRYIEEMENTPSHLQLGVDGWNDDYKMLKHIRWARNQLAHEGIEEYTSEDVQWTKQFYQRLLQEEDPLSGVRRYRESLAGAKKTAKSDGSKRTTGKRANVAGNAGSRASGKTGETKKNAGTGKAGSASAKATGKDSSVTKGSASKKSTSAPQKRKKKIRKSVLVVLALLAGVALGSFCGLDIIGWIASVFTQIGHVVRSMMQ